MLLKLSKFFLYTSVFAVLIVLTGTFFPFIGGKYYFFRVTIELALVCFVLWWAYEAPEGAFANILDMWKKPLVIAVTVFVIAFLLASIFALDPHAAFWSNYERGEGGFQMIHYYIFFVLMLTLLRSKEDWRWMFGVSVAAAGLMMLYGAMSAAYNSPLGLPWPFNFFFIGPYFTNGLPNEPTFWGRLFSNARFQGSLGNPAYVAPYLFFAIFYALWLWLSKKKDTLKATLYLVFAAAALIIFWFSETRGAFLGIVAAAAAYLFFLTVLRPSLRTWTISIFLALFVILGIFISLRQTNFVKNLPGSRLFDLGFSDQTVQTRLWTWGSAWHGFLDSPKTIVFGWGPENFTAVFDKYFNPKHFTPGTNSETWFDRAHSVFFDYLAETGFVGLLSYLGMFVVFYWELIGRTFKKGTDTGEWSRVNALLNGLLFAVPIGYLIQGLALFDVLPIYINVFTFLAFASYLFYFSPEHHDHPVIRVPASHT